MVEGEILINSQDSELTEVGNDKAMVISNNLEAVVKTTLLEGGQSKNIQQNRRRSERLKKDVHLTTLDKYEALAKKRSLEGNSKKHQNISELDNIMLDCLAKDMGVVVQDNGFATFDLIKDLETARNCLYDKHQNMNVNDKIIEEVEFIHEEEKLSVDENQEDGSDYEMFKIHSVSLKSKLKKKFILSPKGRKQD